MIVLCFMYTAQLRNASVFVSEASMTIEVCVMFTEPVAQGGQLTLSTSPSEATCKTIQGFI